MEQDVFGKPAVVCDEKMCYAFEIDTRETIERSKQEIREKIAWFLKFADITIKAEEFVESATMNPAFEESAMFENMLDLMFKNEYDIYIFDTAPTANARRLLGMSKVYSLWVDKMMKSREEAKVLRKALSYTKKEEKDPLMDYLMQFKDRMGHAKVLLTDPQLTSFFFVTLPESLPIAVITRFIDPRNNQIDLFRDEAEYSQSDAVRGSTIRGESREPILQPDFLHTQGAMHWLHVA